MKKLKCDRCGDYVHKATFDGKDWICSKCEEVTPQGPLLKFKGGGWARDGYAKLGQ